MNLLIIDNHDSFVYNIIGLLEKCMLKYGWDIRWDVVRNDDIDCGVLKAYDAVILSPGPGLPHEAGQLMEVIRHSERLRIPVLGICLGCQAIALHFGGILLQMDNPKHGHVTRLIDVDSSDPLTGFCSGLPAYEGRYHSWVVSDDNLPDTLFVTARDEEGLIMALRHRELPLFGFQFHPESIMTETGDRMLHNFLTEVARLRPHRIGQATALACDK